MVFRKIPLPFNKFTTKKKSHKFIINEVPKTFNDAVYPQIPFMIRSKRYNMKNPIDKSLGGQLYGLTFAVTDLFRDERVVLGYNKATEIRPHVERLIVEAIRNGDRHRPTMALANFWLREKNLIHKLFKVFVPRYEIYPTAFTAIHMLGIDYALHGLTMDERAKYKNMPSGPKGQAVIEMRGNNLPRVIRPQLSKPGFLTNVLLDSARQFRESETKSDVITGNTSN